MHGLIRNRLQKNMFEQAIGTDGRCGPFAEKVVDVRMAS